MVEALRPVEQHLKRISMDTQVRHWNRYKLQRIFNRPDFIDLSYKKLGSGRPRR